MCGRFVITSAPEALRRLFGYPEQPNFPPRFNIAPTQPVPVVMEVAGARRFHLMRWGLLPSWVKEPRAFTLLINARAETLGEKPAFRNAIKRRRCLIPADGYYEWQARGSHKQPYFVHRRDDAPFGFAALSETWVGPNGEELDTAAIVTTVSDAAMTPLHHRVPVTIAPKDFAKWLDCSGVSADEASALLVAPDHGVFAWHPVSTRVNKVSNDDAQLTLAISDEEMMAETPVTTKAKAGKSAAARSEKDDGQGSLF